MALSLTAILILATFALMQNALRVEQLSIRLNALSTEQSRLFSDISVKTRDLMQIGSSGEVPEARLDDLRRQIIEAAAHIRVNVSEILDIDQNRFMFEGGVVSRFYRQPPFSLERKLNQFLGRIETIAALDTQKLHGRQQQWSPIDIAVTSSNLMQSDFDKAMSRSFEITDRNIARIRLVESVITACALLMLVLEARYIFAPLVQRLRREHEQVVLHQARLQEQSRHDLLTGLGNRLAFQERLDAGVDDARSTQQSMSLVLFDLDRFKPVNDALGHLAGDALLQAVADRARSSAGPDAFVARLGGDEFGILSPEADTIGGLERLIRRVKQAVEQEVPFQSHCLQPVASFGGALLSGSGPERSDWLMGAADLAVIRAKQDRLGHAIFNAEMRAAAAAERQLAIDLKRAVGAAELQVYFQPQVRLADRSIIGFEALIRWNHPERGLLGPGLFLSCAEQHGLMTDLTAFVVEQVAAALRDWIKLGFDPGVVAINVPESMLATPLARQTIQLALGRHRLDHGRICVEVTENVLLNRNAGQIIDTLRSMQSDGARVSFDDFGTGYASLSHLKSFPLDEIKIDRSFINDLLTEESSAEIVRSLIKLAAKLKKTVVAEGIETEEQLQFLLEEGCAIGQGYLFSRPVPFEQATELLARPWTPAVCPEDAPRRTLIAV